HHRERGTDLVDPADAARAAGLVLARRGSKGASRSTPREETPRVAPLSGIVGRSALDMHLKVQRKTVGRAGRIVTQSRREESIQENGPGLRIPGFSTDASACVAR